MRNISTRRFGGGWLALGILASAFLVGCEGITGESIILFNIGFESAFTETNEHYDRGYNHSFDVYDNSLPIGCGILYEGDLIGAVDALTIPAGLLDGEWYAYHDGYFAAYDDAFIIGFSEGYDVAFHEDWPTFLDLDEHLEWLDGSFRDGYHDGFTEGRIFGASDFENSELPFDWVDALLFYTFEDDVAIDVTDSLTLSTGVDGPAFLYEHGVDPATEITEPSDCTPLVKGTGSFRSRAKAKQAGFEAPEFMKREFSPEVLDVLQTTVESTVRGDRDTDRLEDTWFDRLIAYENAGGKKKTARKIRQR